MRLVEHARLDRLEQALLLRRPQPRGVDDQQDVGGAHRAFALDPLEQLLVAGLDPVDLDAGRLGEVVVERLVGLVVARRVEVEDGLLGGMRQRGSDDGEGKRRQGGGTRGIGTMVMAGSDRWDAMPRIMRQPRADVNTNANYSYLIGIDRSRSPRRARPASAAVAQPGREAVDRQVDRPLRPLVGLPARGSGAAARPAGG